LKNELVLGSRLVAPEHVVKRKSKLRNCLFYFWASPVPPQRPSADEIVKLSLLLYADNRGIICLKIAQKFNIRKILFKKVISENSEGFLCGLEQKRMESNASCLVEVSQITLFRKLLHRTSYLLILISKTREPFFSLTKKLWQSW